MSELTKIPPVPVPRRSKQPKTPVLDENDVFVESDLSTLSPGVKSIDENLPAIALSDFADKATSDTSSRGRSSNGGNICGDLNQPARENSIFSKAEVDDTYEIPNPSSENTADNTEGSQIYEEFCPGAPWQQELVAWLMAREFGNSMPFVTRPLPQTTDPPTPESSLSFMSSNLAQRASLVLSRLSAASPSTRLLVDFGQGSGSAYSSLKKKKSNASVAPLASMNELDTDFLALFGVNPVQSVSESTSADSNTPIDIPMVPESLNDQTDAVVANTQNEENDHICEEFPVVSLRKGQPVRISVDRQDGSICWISGTSEKAHRTVNGDVRPNHNIHRRMLVMDVLRANVDVKSRHVVYLATMPGNQYVRESPFSYACGSVQAAVALITCIAKTMEVYSSSILASVNPGCSGGVLCLGRVLYRQQSLQQWTMAIAIITESRHFVIIRTKPDTNAKESSGKSVVDHAIDLRYVRELHQESAGDGDGSRLLYVRFGTSTTASLYIRPVCACSSIADCVCSSTGCEPCAAQFNTWQSILENLARDASTASNSLVEQRMSESELPAIVDRILSHLTLCCLTCEGLHRQAGRVRVANELIAAFKRDPWSVRFESTAKDGENISAHDIVSTLKKFFQSLDRPLLLTGVDEKAESSLASSWIAAHFNRFGAEARLAEYRKAFSMLHPVARRTLQAMLLHLRTVAALEAQNRMNFLALAASWGPTLLCSQSSESPPVDPTRRNADNMPTTLRLADVLPHGKSIVAGAIGVVIDLLSEMDSICPLDAMSESVRRDAHVQDIAVRLHLQPQQHKQAGEITLQVEVDLSNVHRFKSRGLQLPSETLGNLNARRRSSHAVHVSPKLMAADLIRQLCSVDEGIANCSDELSVWEYLAGGELRRPLLPSTRLLDVCCAWASLEPDALRIDCKLVIEASPVEVEEHAIYEISGSNQQIESESIVSFKTSIPCIYCGAWTPESFAESNAKLKHWLYITDSEVLIKSMKAAPSALVGASLGHEDRHHKVARNASVASSTTSGRPGGSFRSFFNTALSHIQAHRLTPSGRVKFTVNFSDITAIYAAHRNTTAGLVFSTRSKVTSSDEQSQKLNFHAIYLLNEQVRDRLLSYFFSLLASDSGSSDASKA